MEAEFEPTLISEIRKYGGFDLEACFNCGSCAAVCTLNENYGMFPRKSMRYARLGLKEALLGSVDPWHCYYCGECSTTCPRQTEPGESMMTLRRYLIAAYDFTGISKWFYKNQYLQVFLSLGLFAAVLYFFSGYKGDFGKLAAGLEFAFPVYVTIAIAGYLWNMYRHVVLKPTGKFRLSFKPKDIYDLFYHGLTQINFTKCQEKDWLRWISHLLVMSGYVLTLVISNLHLFEPLDIHYSTFNFTSLLILYSSFSIIIGGLFMMIRRIFKDTPSSKFSTPSDWLFVVSLFLIGLTMLSTLMMNIKLGQTNPSLESVYKIHMSVEVVWIVLIVPFTKWIHIFFRPLAVYFDAIRENEHRLAGGDNITGKTEQAL